MYVQSHIFPNWIQNNTVTLLHKIFAYSKPQYFFELLSSRNLVVPSVGKISVFISLVRDTVCLYICLAVKFLLPPFTYNY